MNVTSIILDELTSLVPHRSLNHQEALVIAEIQAMKLLELTKIKEPAVPVVELARQAGVHVAYRSDAGELGEATQHGGAWLIHYSNLDLPHVHATVAHQLKLILDHSFGDALYPHQDVMAPQLRRHHVAEYFATCLTLPQNWLEQLWTEGVQDPADLARRFSATQTAVEFRLRALRLLKRDCPDKPSATSAITTYRCLLS